jgi:hypothetical protein
MKNLSFFLALMLVLGLSKLSGQNSTLIVFTAEKEDFTLWINGYKINNVPGQHLRVTGLKPSDYTIEATFQNLNQAKQTIRVTLQPEREITYGLVRRGSASPLEFKFLNESTLGYFPVAPQKMEIIPYYGPVQEPQPPVTTPTPQPVPVPQPVPQPVPAPVIVVAPNPLPGYTGLIGCQNPMDASQFSEAKKSIASKSFSDTKMQLAEQITRSNCLLTSQVTELMGLFSFESQKLQFAKFAYGYTYDKGNYYKVNDAFGFESSIRDLEQYLKGK